MQLSIRSPEVAKIAGGRGAIESTKATSAARKGPEQIEAYDLVLRAHAAMWLWTHDSFRSALELLGQAIAIDPENARARREIAWLAVVGLISHLDEKPVPSAGLVELASEAGHMSRSGG